MPKPVPKPNKKPELKYSLFVRLAIYVPSLTLSLTLLFCTMLPFDKLFPGLWVVAESSWGQHVKKVAG